MIALVALARVAWWFLVGWMASGGFARIGLAVYRRTSLRTYLAGEWAILRAPFFLPDDDALQGVKLPL